MNAVDSNKVSGSCLCGKVSYQLNGNLGIFQYCYCSLCRKSTGSAHASNVFVSPEQFKWASGEELVGTYFPESTKYYATAFCKNCGSFLPWFSKSGKAVIVPAGTLDDDPGLRPSKNIFCASRADWYVEEGSLPCFDEFEPRNK